MACGCLLEYSDLLDASAAPTSPPKRRRARFEPEGPQRDHEQLARQLEVGAHTAVLLAHSGADSPSVALQRCRCLRPVPATCACACACACIATRRLCQACGQHMACPHLAPAAAGEPLQREAGRAAVQGRHGQLRHGRAAVLLLQVLVCAGCPGGRPSWLLRLPAAGLQCSREEGQRFWEAPPPEGATASAGWLAGWRRRSGCGPAPFCSGTT